jgi:site-specific DNA recombinase
MDLVAYIRVSRVGGREGDSFQSPREQRRAIDAVVALKPGVRIIGEPIEDLDESGGSMDRPGAQRAIAMVESGQADGIVVAKLDRWARNLEALEMIERWVAQGKTFISAADQFDAKTPQGKLTLGMLLLVAKYYRDQTAESWDHSTRDAIERGVHVTVPFGYRRSNGRGSPLAVDEPNAATVRRIFEERQRGTGIASIASRLNADKVPAPRGGLWTRQSVRALVRVRAYSGVASRGEYETEGAHEAIIEPHDWLAAQTERGESRERTTSLLAGLVRCAGCGYVMGAGSSLHGGRRYHCNRHHAEIDCPSPTTAPADALERLVSDEFLARYGDVRVQGADADPRVAECEVLLERTRARYESFRRDHEARDIMGLADWRADLADYRREVDDAERAHADAVRETATTALTVDGDVWATLDVAERGELMTAGLDAVVLSRAGSTHTPLRERVTILWAGQLEHDGSRSGIAASVRERRP